MVADPEPEVVPILHRRQGPIAAAHSDRPEFVPDLLEMQGRVMRISFEQLEVFIGYSLDGFGEIPVVLPEIRGGAMLQGI